MHIMYIYNLLETDFAVLRTIVLIMSDLLENFHSRTINQTRDVGGLSNSEGTRIAMRSNGLQPQVFYLHLILPEFFGILLYSSFAYLVY